MAITVRRLREDLQTVIAGMLGVYTLPNGAVTPAISVRADSESIAAGTKVSGLELVINKHPNIDPIRQYAREGCLDSWEVWLLSWDGTAKITEAAAEIVLRYPGTTAQVITLPEGWGPKRQIKLELQQPQHVDVALLDVDGGDFVSDEARVAVASVLDGGNFFDGSTLNTYVGAVNGGKFT